jgi:hypothetical protein
MKKEVSLPHPVCVTADEIRVSLEYRNQREDKAVDAHTFTE